ncbi:MAG: NEAT domain-containing protein, partial [Bacillota bacterium]
MTRKRRQIKQFHKKMMSLVLLSSLTLSNFSGVIYAEDLLEDPELDITQEELYEELQEELFEETENEFLGEEREESEEGLAGEEEAGSEEESEEVEDDADSDDVKEKSDSKPSHHVESSGAVDGKGKKMRDITLIDDGISLMSSFVMLTSESGGFSDWEAGRYAVPVSVLNISNTAIAELADSAIGDGVDDEYDYGDRSAVLVIDDSGNATLTLTLETFERNGYGSTLSENLTTRDSYISDVKYYTTSDGGETYVSASATESKTDGGIVTEIQIPITDKTVDGMYINYEQKSVEGGYVLAAVNAYLEIDYAVQKVLPAPVYYFGQNNIPFEEGSHNIPVTIKSTTGGDFNANNTLSDMTANDDFTNAIFTVDSNGNASLTMKFTYSKGSSWGKTTYLGTENIWYYASDELSTNTSTADLTLSTLATDRTSDTSTGKTFINEVTIPIETNYTVSGGDGIFIYCIYFNSGSSSSRGNAFLQIDYDHCAPEPEYSDDDYAKRYTVGSERTMFGMGTYDIKAYFKKAGEEDEDSMASAALKEDAQLLVDVDGNVTVLLEFQQATIMGFAGNGNNFKYFTTYPDGDEIAATVLTTSGGYPRKILVGHDDVHVDGVYVSMEIKTSLMDMDQTGYMLLDLSGVGEPYNPTTVTLRDGEDYWDSSGDFVAPTIAIDGYFHGSTVEIEQGAKLEAFTVPTATVTDNVDTGLTATEYYYTVNEYDDAADALAALAAVKAYLAEAVGNQVRIYYRATDAAGNQGYTYITLVSIEEDLNEYEDVTQNGTYGVSVELLKEYEDNASMGDPAFDGHRTAKVTTENGVYTVEIGVGTITMMGLTSGIENITSEDGKMTDIAEETTTLPDGTVYTSKFTFKTTSLESTYLMGFGIAGMDMAQKARLALDWDKATVYDENGNGGEEGEGEGEGEGQEPEEPEEPELDTDETAPVLSITGYSDGDAITVSMAAIDVLTLPVVTATDEVDGDVSVTTVISNDIIEFLDFDFAKVFLKATAGNSVKVTYTATDAAGNEANATIAFTSKENPSNDGLLKDNTSYGVPVRLLKEYEDNASMGDSAFDGFRTAKVTNRGGVYTVEVNVGTVTFGGTLTSGLINVKSEDGTIFNIKEEYSTLSDGIVYTSKFTFTTTELLDTYAITFDIAEMDMTHAARLELDWEKAEEIGGAEALYFTFGTAKTMLYNGTHGMTVKVSNPADNTKTSLLTSAISTASTMTVDGNGGGKVTLRFADVTLDGTSHTPQDFMYYTSSDLSPASLVEADFVSATEAEFVISDPTIDGIYISTALGDSFVTASAYVELEYVRCMTGVAYDAEKVTERVEIVPPTGDDDTNTDTDADTNTDADTDTDTEDNNNNNNNNNTNSDFADINVNGTYDVPVYLYKETGSELSMGDAA